MKYFFINADVNPELIYGSDYPTCLSEKAVRALSNEWGVDLFEQMHEASQKEIESYGVFED